MNFAISLEWKFLIIHSDSLRTYLKAFHFRLWRLRMWQNIEFTHITLTTSIWHVRISDDSVFVPVIKREERPEDREVISDEVWTFYRCLTRLLSSRLDWRLCSQSMISWLCCCKIIGSKRVWRTKEIGSRGRCEGACNSIPTTVHVTVGSSFGFIRSEAISRFHQLVDRHLLVLNSYHGPMSIAGNQDQGYSWNGSVSSKERREASHKQFERQACAIKRQGDTKSP